MKSRKDKWSFVEIPTYPTISREERLYWRELTKKILKAGIEFEMNLPDKRGSCTGNNPFCACVNVPKGCWKVCYKEKECKKKEQPHSCLKRIEDKCEKAAESDPNINTCKDCKKFEFKCINIDCIEFTSECYKCNKRRTDCNECPEKYDPEKDPAKIRKNLQSLFQPTGSFSHAGKHGVWSIATDGSLKGDGGLEVITIGRRLHFQTFYNMIKEIIDQTTKNGAFLDERCGIHQHVLNGYYEGGGTELETPMPPIVLANIIQIVRKYHPALVWLTCAGNKIEHLTRWEKFRLGMLDHSPLTKTLSQLKADMSHESKKCGNIKYHFMNIQRCNFSKDDTITTLHLEFRFPDSVNCPLIIASQSILFYSIVMRAIDFSQYGVLEFALSPEEKQIIESAFKAICNGRGGWDSSRLSDTKNAKKYFGYYRETAKDLLDICKPVMIEFGPAYDILRDLADMPVALRKIQGATDKEIEEELSRFIVTSDKELEEQIMSAIDLSLYTECNSLKEWIGYLIEDIRKDNRSTNGKELAKKIEAHIEKEMEGHTMVWNSKTGTLISR